MPVAVMLYRGVPAANIPAVLTSCLPAALVSQLHNYKYMVPAATLLPLVAGVEWAGAAG